MNIYNGNFNKKSNSSKKKINNYKNEQVSLKEFALSQEKEN